MNAPYLEDIRPTFVVHGLSPLQSKVSRDKMSEIITGHIKTMKISNVLMVSSLLLNVWSWNYIHFSFGRRISFRCSSLFSESSNWHHHSRIGAPLSREGLPHLSECQQKSAWEHRSSFQAYWQSQPWNLLSSIASDLALTSYLQSFNDQGLSWRQSYNTLGWSN